MFVSDGFDFRPPGDQLQYAIFVFDIAETPPTPAFTATPTSGVAPLTVQFTDTPAGMVNSYFWDFGDGTTSAVKNPPHLYSAFGQWVEFDVTTTVTASGEYSFTLANGNSNVVAFSSREGANAPQLVVSFS